MRADGEISKEEFAESKNTITEQISILNSELTIDEVESDEPESIEKKIEVIKQAMNKVIDFSQPKLPKYIIDKFISKVLVLDNNKFRWYINLGNDYDKNSDIYLDTQVEGRKNNYSAQILSNDDSLSSVHSSTGSYR